VITNVTEADKVKTYKKTVSGETRKSEWNFDSSLMMCSIGHSCSTTFRNLAEHELQDFKDFVLNA